MNLLQIIDTINYFIGDKFPETPMLTPKRFDTLLHQASLKHFKRKLGLPEEYQVGMPLPRQAYDLTQKISTDLEPFKVYRGVDNPLFIKGGVVDLPKDYYYPSSLMAIIDYEIGSVRKRVRFVTDQRWDDMHSNYVDIPNNEYPIGRIIRNRIEVSPTHIARGLFTYLRLPKPTKYAVKQNANVGVYDHDNSVQLEWDEINQIDIMHVLLSDLGLPMKRQDIYQVAENKKAQGI
jgi:hypothetical protein